MTESRSPLEPLRAWSDMVIICPADGQSPTRDERPRPCGRRSPEGSDPKWPIFRRIVAIPRIGSRCQEPRSPPPSYRSASCSRTIPPGPTRRRLRPARPRDQPPHRVPIPLLPNSALDSIDPANPAPMPPSVRPSAKQTCGYFSMASYRLGGRRNCTISCWLLVSP
jgi:hypothetical protein